MQALKSVAQRFMQLLPFLTTPNSFRRFHFELFYPYPDILAGRKSGRRHHGMRNRPAHGSQSSVPAETHLRPYLTWPELHESGSQHGEPFC